MSDYWDYVARASKPAPVIKTKPVPKSSDTPRKQSAKPIATDSKRKGDKTPDKAWAVLPKLTKQVCELLSQSGREVIGKTEHGDGILTGDIVVRAVSQKGGRTIGAGAVREFRQQCGEHACLILTTNLLFYCDAIECAKAEGEKQVTLIDGAAIEALKKAKKR